MGWVLKFCALVQWASILGFYILPKISIEILYFIDVVE